MRRLGRPGARDLDAELVRACDRAAQEHPHRERPWLELMAEAACDGHLDYAWLERPVAACIRLSVDDPPRQARLRAHHDARPYEADLARLDQVYGPAMEARARSERAPGGPTQLLLEEAGGCPRPTPPAPSACSSWRCCAQLPRRPSPPQRRLRRALGRLDEAALGRSEVAGLLGLYVRNLEVDSARADLIRRVHQPALERGLVDPDEIELYMIVGDYERAFSHLRCKYDGVALSHADKHAATRVKYFVEKRVKPGSVHRIIDAAFAPVEWLGASVGQLGAFQQAVGRGLRAFEQRARAMDLGEQVVAELREQGAPIERLRRARRAAHRLTSNAACAAGAASAC